MDIIMTNKVKLIRWLTGQDMILQHVSQKLITPNEYMKIKSIQDPTEKSTELLDVIVSKGGSLCVAFLELLKEDEVNESRPELREWIQTVNISAPAKTKDIGNTTEAGTARRIEDNLAFLRKNRSKLIDKIKCVDQIVDDLDMGSESEANVRAQKIPQVMMRKVLEYTTSKRAAKLLVDALFKHAEDVMEDICTD